MCPVTVVNVLLAARYEHFISPIVFLSGLLLLLAFLSCFMKLGRERFLAKNLVVGWMIIALNVVLYPQTVVVFFFTITSLLCLNPNTPYFNSVMLLAIVFKSSTLRNVIKSVILPFRSLAMSSLLGLVCIYIFTVFGFYFFPDEFYNEDQSIDECSNLMLCFVTFLHGGFLSGGGIADHFNDLGHEPVRSDSENLSYRVTYDIAFFVIIIILLLNIIFGIIIDTFGSLREEQNEQYRLKTSYCFICGLSKEELDARALDATSTGNQQRDFDGHVNMEHNMWDYLFYRIYLSIKDPSEFNGYDSYVAELLVDDDFSWVPKGKTLGVNDNEHVAVDPETIWNGKINDFKESLNKDLHKAAQTLQSSTDTLGNVLDSIKEDIKDLKIRVDNVSRSVATANDNISQT